MVKGRNHPPRILKGKPPKPGLLIFERDNFTCAYCIRVFDHVRLNMDHIFPASQGGPAVAGNLITACRGCNYDKAGDFLTTDEETCLLGLACRRGVHDGRARGWGGDSVKHDPFYVRTLGPDSRLEVVRSPVLQQRIGGAMVVFISRGPELDEEGDPALKHAIVWWTWSVNAAIEWAVRVDPATLPGSAVAVFQ